jgi:hypothetical protein
MDVPTKRLLNIRRGFGALLLGMTITAVAGCGATSPQPTAVGIPPTSVVLPTGNAAPTVPATRIWKKQPVGNSSVTITFYTGSNGRPCVRFQLDTGNNAPVEKCAAANNLVAVQGVTPDSGGKMYTVIVGRALSDQITAVSLEMANGTNMPAEISDGGFAVVLAGQQKAIRAVPIDQYGNLVGRIYAFS